MAQKPRSLRTPAATQARVVAGSLAGKSKSELHRETGLGRATIRRILSQSEVEAILASYRDQVRDLVPNALRVCARNLAGKRASWQLAIEILLRVLLMLEFKRALRVVPNLEAVECFSDCDGAEFHRDLCRVGIFSSQVAD
jgi:hypothetical protein